MKTVKEVMATDVVWVSPTARVKTAVILMKGHNIGALPVLQTNYAVAGIVTYQDILGEPQDVPVMDVMRADYASVAPDTNVFEAAEVMHQSGASYLLVLEENHLTGIVSLSDLLPELGKTYDPVTELPWSDSLRDWAMNALKRGLEVSILFYDLDQFGLFNKKHGHVVGDTVLKEVADVFKKSIDSELDLACRYGGDEFAVVSVRNADQAVSLGDIIKDRISGIRIEDVPEGVSSSYGLFGGRRTKEREDTHYAATIDNLITRASKECTAHKPHRAGGAAPAPQAPQAAPPVPSVMPYLAPAVGGRIPRLKIKTISISTSGAEAQVDVTLSRGGQEYSRSASGYVVDGSSTLRLIAQAAADAACKSLAPEHGIAIDQVWLDDTGKEEVVTLVAVFISPRYTVRNSGSAIVRRGDQYRASAAAVLAAVNRFLESSPHELPEEPGIEPTEG